MNSHARLIRCAQIDTYRAYHDSHIEADREHGRLMDAPDTIPAGSVRVYDSARDPFIAARVIYRDYP